MYHPPPVYQEYQQRSLQGLDLGDAEEAPLNIALNCAFNRLAVSMNALAGVDGNVRRLLRTKYCHAVPKLNFTTLAMRGVRRACMDAISLMCRMMFRGMDPLEAPPVLDFAVARLFVSSSLFGEALKLVGGAAFKAAWEQRQAAAAAQATDDAGPLQPLRRSRRLAGLPPAAVPQATDDAGPSQLPPPPFHRLLTARARRSLPAEVVVLRDFPPAPFELGFCSSLTSVFYWEFWTFLAV